MKPPVKDDVEKILKRIEPDLCNIVRGAWQDWLESSEVGRTRFSRTRANVVWDRMINRAYETFPPGHGVRYIEKYQTVSFVLENRVLFRFKKGDFKGLTHNIPTQLSIAFHDHNIALFEDNLSRVEVVYTLNKLETKLERVCVVGRDRDIILWSYDIMPQAVIEEFPVPSVQKTPPEELVELREPEEETKTEIVRGN